MERKLLGKEYIRNLFNSRTEGSIHLNGSLGYLKQIISDMNLEVIDELDADKLPLQKFKDSLSRCNKTSNRKKILIVNRAHLMTPEVYNMALKTIEEQRGTFFVFVSTGNLAPTIKSRSISVDCDMSKSVVVGLISLEDVVSRLKDDSKAFLSEILEFVLTKRVDLLEEILEIREQERLNVNIESAVISILNKMNLFKI